MTYRIEQITKFVDRMHAILADDSVERIELTKEEYTAQELSVILNTYLAEAQTSQQRAAMLEELAELATQAAASITLTAKTAALLFAINHTVTTCSTMVDAIDQALKLGVHARRAALELTAQGIATELRNIHADLSVIAKDGELSAARQPEEVTWVPLARVLAVLNHPNFYWGNTNMAATAKYLELRIDTRDNHCVVMDAKHKLLDIKHLEEACLKFYVPNMNENVCPREKGPKALISDTQTEPASDHGPDPVT